MAQGIDSLISNFAGYTYVCLYDIQIVGPTDELTQAFKDTDRGVLSAQSVTIPGKSLETIDAGGNGGRYPIKTLPIGYKVDEVSIDFILTEAYKQRDAFEKWFDLIINPGQYRNAETGDGRAVKRNYMVNYLKKYAAEIIITQLDSHQKPIYEITLHNAFPKQISSIELNASNVELTKLSVNFGYYDYDTVKLLSYL